MRNDKISNIAGVGLMIAIVIILQYLGSFIKFGPFSISLVLVPIVVGACLYGPLAGAILGFIFGLIVLISGDAAAFLVIDVLGTIITVLLKGTLCGLFAGLVYRAFKKNKNIGAVCASIIAPITNTGIFLICCLLFFMPTITEWANAFGFDNVYSYMFLGLVGANFLFELLVNMVLSPVIIRLIKIGEYRNRK